MSDPKVLVIGEALIDLVPQAATTADGLPHYVPLRGGSPYNVALGLGRLGVPTTWLGRLSTGDLGRGQRDHFVDSGVDTSLVIDTDDPAALALVHPPAAGDDDVSYSFYMQATAGFEVHPTDVPETLPQSLIHLHMGSIAAVKAPTSDALDRLLDHLGDSVSVSFDPNCRPTITPDRVAVGERVDALAKRSTVIKASEADLDWLYPGIAVGEVADRWRAAGVGLVVITRGKRGMSAYGDGIVTSIPGLADIEVADTVGAGDSVMSALLYALHDQGRLGPGALSGITRKDMDRALRIAQRAASLTVSRPGADPPRLTELSEPV